MLSFSDQFHGIASRDFGIRPAHARSAVEHPDQKELITLSGSQRFIALYLKSVPSTRRPRSLLVLTARDEKGEEGVLEAWPVPASILPPAVTPLAALRALSDHCGNDLRIGSKTFRFILSETVAGRPGDVHVDASQSEGKQHVAFFARAEEAKGTIQVALGYSINIDALKRAL